MVQLLFVVTLLNGIVSYIYIYIYYCCCNAPSYPPFYLSESITFAQNVALALVKRCPRKTASSTTTTKINTTVLQVCELDPSFYLSASSLKFGIVVKHIKKSTSSSFFFSSTHQNRPGRAVGLPGNPGTPKGCPGTSGGPPK